MLLAKSLQALTGRVGQTTVMLKTHVGSKGVFLLGYQKAKEVSSEASATEFSFT